MFEDVRRSITGVRDVRAKKKMKTIEKERRLSYLRMKRFQARKDIEEELSTQTQSEISARTDAQRALAERKQMMAELRGPGVVKGTIKTVRRIAKIGKGINMEKAVLGDTKLIFGSTRKTDESVHEMMFGKLPKSAPPGHKGSDIFDIGDILK